jgi:hypothetical protein
MKQDGIDFRLGNSRRGLPMKRDFNFTGQRRENGYVFVAKQYGVVVWAAEASSGFQELESRVESVAAQFREAGVDPEPTDIGSPLKSGLPGQWPKQVISILLILAIVAWPLSLIYTRVVSFFETIEHPITLFLRLADKVDEVTPPRIDEVKVAIRKIATKIGPLVEEARISTTSERPANEPVQQKSQ